MKLRLGLRLLLAVLLSSTVLLLAQTQLQIGRWEDMRIPMFDYLPYSYHFFKPNPTQWQIDPDPTGRSDGILTIKPSPSGQSYTFGAGLITVTTPGLPTQVFIDTAYVMHLNTDPAPPIMGSACQSSTELWMGAEGFFYCIPNSARTGFVWTEVLTVVAPTTPPVIGSLCGDGGKWSEKNGLYVCSATTSASPLWAMVPMTTNK